MDGLVREDGSPTETELSWDGSEHRRKRYESPRVRFVIYRAPPLTCMP